MYDAETNENDTIASKDGGGGNTGWIFRRSSSNAISGIINTSSGQIESVGSNSSVSINTWYHVVMTYNNSGDKVVHLYQNGQEVTYSTKGTTTSAPLDDSSYSLYIGEIGTWDFNGKIDDLRIYNRALTPSEVEGLYNWAPGPVAEWKMDEGSGTTVFDKSGNANTGTLTNGPLWTTGQVRSGCKF